MPTYVITPPVAEPVTLAEARQHLRVDQVDAANDALISTLIIVARELAEHRLQRTLMLQTLEHSMDAFPSCRPILLPNPPVIDLLSITYTAQDGTPTVLSADVYTADLHSEPARLIPAYGYYWPVARCHDLAAVRVRYRAGYSTSSDVTVARAAVPQPIKQWMLLAIGDMYARREASSDKPAVPHNFVDRLLDPYRIYNC